MRNLRTWAVDTASDGRFLEDLWPAPRAARAGGPGSDAAGAGGVHEAGAGRPAGRSRAAPGGWRAAQGPAAALRGEAAQDAASAGHAGRGGR